MGTYEDPCPYLKLYHTKMYKMTAYQAKTLKNDCSLKTRVRQIAIIVDYTPD